MLLEETVNILKPLYKEHDASIVFKTKKEVYINGDYNKLKQVLINILKNTIEARDENKKLIATIKLIENKKSVCLSIEDTGMGMTKETLSKVSNIFFTTSAIILPAVTGAVFPGRENAPATSIPNPAASDADTYPGYADTSTTRQSERRYAKDFSLRIFCGMVFIRTSYCCPLSI